MGEQDQRGTQDSQAPPDQWGSGARADRKGHEDHPESRDFLAFPARTALPDTRGNEARPENLASRDCLERRG